MNLLSSLPDAAVLPKVGTDFNLHWDFNPSNPIPQLTFDNTKIYLDSFNKFLEPVISKVSLISNTVKPVYDALNTPIGFLKELTKEEVSLLKLAEIGGVVSSEDAASVKEFGKVFSIIDRLSKFTSSDGDGFVLGSVNLGSFDLRDSSKTLEQATARAGNNSRSAADQAPKGQGLSFPILNSPTSAIQLLLGQNVDLFKYDLPVLQFSAQFDKPFQIIGPITGLLQGEITAKIDLGFGFDAQGLIDWRKTDFKADQIGKIFNGFYIDDNREPNPGGQTWKVDNPEATLTGSIAALGGVGLAGIAGAYVGGGISASMFVDLENEGEKGRDLGASNNPDGNKVRGTYIQRRIENDQLGCLLEFSGQIDAFLEAQARVLFKKWRYRSAPQVIAKFDLSTPCPDREPILANEGPEKNGQPTQNPDLWLNIGLRAGQRQSGDTSDGAERFKLQGTGALNNDTVTVTAFGHEQAYQGVNKVFANAGQSNDVIEVENLAIPVEFSGGDGHDFLQGGLASDLLKGDKGSDRLEGGGGNDKLYGGENDDLLDGGEGDDELHGGAGSDQVIGGTGNDKLYADAGSVTDRDALFGEEGDDELFGDSNNDFLDGGDGADIFYGRAGDDQMYGGAGDDLFIGEIGNDSISGGSETDTITYKDALNRVVVNLDEENNYQNLDDGLEPDFVIEAGRAVDGYGTTDFFKFTAVKYILDSNEEDIIGQENVTIAGSLENVIGSRFNDVLIGNSANNQIEAREGNDLLIGNAGNDTLNGGNGVDTVSYHRDRSSVSVNLSTRTATDGFGGRDEVLDIENVVGSAFNDSIIGDDKTNIITAGNGADTVEGGAGADLLYGESGNDRLMGNAGNDLIDGGSEIDTVSYADSPSGVIVNIDETKLYSNIATPTDLEPTFNIAAGTAIDGFGTTDTLRNLENIIGSNYNDVLIGNSLDNRIEAGNGSDVVIGNAGNDFLDGGDGIDTVSYRRDPNAARISLEDGRATDGFGNIDTLRNFENVVGSDFGDTIIGNDQVNIIYGGSGNDTIEARGGNDLVFGNAGNDSIKGEDGDDKLVGGEGADTLNGGTGIDTASYFTAESGVTASLTTGRGTVGDARGDVFQQIENLEGSEFGDRLMGDSQANILWGLGGNDFLDGREGNDTLEGGDGEDALSGSGGNDLLLGQAGDDNLDGGDGNDTLNGGEGNDFLEGRSGDDRLEGDNGDDTFFGGEGNDTLLGQSGADNLDGGEGNDVLDGGTGDDLLFGAQGNDQLFGAEGSDHIEGGDGNDQLFGGEDEDFLYGQNGDDWLEGGSGNDQLSGDAGNDTLNGQAGEDLLEGGTGNDQLLGGTEADTLQGGEGNDQLLGEAGNDLLFGGTGNDTLDGGEGNDRLLSEAGDDSLFGGIGNDSLDGGSGADLLLGQDGDDLLVGGTGNDSLNGGADHDVLNGEAGDDLLVGEAGNDTINGGSDVDTVSYQSSPSAVVVNLSEIGYSNPVTLLEPGFAIAASAAQDGYGTVDTLQLIENIIGSEFSDVLVGNAVANFIQGLAGNDLLIGNAGNDRLDGGTGIDTVSYRYDPNAVSINLELSVATDGFASTDMLINIENVVGSAFNDSIIGNNGINIILANTGDDLVFARGGHDQIYGEAGNDTLAGEAGDDLLVGGTGNDSLLGGEGADTLLGQAGDDSLNGGNGADSLLGDEGDDRINGGLGNDSIEGGLGNDTLTGGGGRDRFFIHRNDDTDIVTDFGGVGRSGIPLSPSIVAEIDTLHFNGEGLIARNLLLNQNGNNLEITFEGITDTQVTLQNFALENLDNLSQTDAASGNLGNLLFVFDGQTEIQDNLDIFNADWQYQQVLRQNAITFLNDLNNITQGFDNSNDVINGQGGDDLLWGLSGDDLLRGGIGNDTLYGGAGNDTLTGDLGADQFFGGLGNDVFNLGLDTAADTVFYTFGDGSDTINQFSQGAGGDLLNFSNVAEIDVVSNGSSTWFRLGDGIAGNAGFGSGTTLLTLSGTTGFSQANIGLNLAAGNTAKFLFA